MKNISGYPLKNLSLVTLYCLFSCFLLTQVPYIIIFLHNLFLNITKYCHISNISQ